MKMKKMFAALLIASMALGMTACGGSQESNAENNNSGGNKPTYELKISTTQANTSMIYKGLQAVADEIIEKTDGDVKVTVYPSSQLGAEENMIDQAIAGMGIAVLTDAGRMSSYVKDMGIFNMAYFVENYEDGLKVMETPTFKKWEDELVAQGIRIFSFNFYDGARSFMGHKPIKTPADLKGVVTRTPSADPYNYSIAAMGATPYNIAWSDVYNSIQTKAIDACEAQYTSAVSSAIYEVCEYVNKTEHINLFNCLIGGEKWFSELPEEYQQIVTEACYNNAYTNAQEIIAAQSDLEKTLVDNGMTIVDVDKEAFKTAVESAYEQLGWTELRQQLYTEAGLNS